MKIYLYRYTKDYYIFDGRLPNNLLEIISLFKIKEVERIINIDGNKIVTPLFLINKREICNLIKYINLTKIKIEIKYVNDIENYIYYGSLNEESQNDALICYEDKFGNYIYIGNNIKGCKLVNKHPIYIYNKTNIEALSLNKVDLFLEDLIKNTNIEIQEDLIHMFTNGNEYLDIFKIMNRLYIKK